MQRLLISTRYFILLPIIGLALAAVFFFVFGGIGLIRVLVELLPGMLGGATYDAEARSAVIIEVVEFVHVFLVGTVLFITAIGLYQLFIHEIEFQSWLQIDNVEELETNLIGVLVVVLAVDFLGTVFVGQTENLLQYGAGIALPIAALGLFVGLRAWSNKLNQEIAISAENSQAKNGGERASQKLTRNQLKTGPKDQMGDGN
jgi:uncharacterized membrane protein YqhA